MGDTRGCPVPHVAEWTGLLLGAVSGMPLGCKSKPHSPKAFVSHNADFWMSINLTPVFTSHFIPNWSSKQDCNCGTPPYSILSTMPCTCTFSIHVADLGVMGCDPTRIYSTLRDPFSFTEGCKTMTNAWIIPSSLLNFLKIRF